jgi:hypothetical protein
MFSPRGPTFLGASREDRGKGRPGAGGSKICGVMGNTQSFSADPGIRGPLNVPVPASRLTPEGGTRERWTPLIGQLGGWVKVD